MVTEPYPTFTIIADPTQLFIPGAQFERKDFATSLYFAGNGSEWYEVMEK